MVDQERIAAGRAAERRKTIVYRSLIGFAVLVVAATVGWVVYRSQEPSGLPDPSRKPAANYLVPAGASKEGVTVGNASAPVTVDVYLDYECPHCRDFERKSADFFDQQLANGTVKVNYHPISILNGYSVWAASAAGCAVNEAATAPPVAGAQPGTPNEVFTRFTKEVYRRGGELNRGDLVAVGKTVGLVSPQFQQCVRSSTYQDWALGLTRYADAQKVPGTPAVAVNGKPVPKSKTMDKYVTDTKRAITTAAQK